MVSSTPDSLQRTVIDAALSIVASSGPDDVSLREVARAAGVSHQAPYHYFKDREGLFAAICGEGFAALADALTAASVNSAESMFVSYVRFARTHTGHFRVMFRRDICNLEKYPTALAEADRAFGMLTDLVVKVIRPGATVNDIRLTATYMWSTAHGLATLLLDGPLEKKIGAIPDVDEFVVSLARVAARALQ